MEYLTLYPCWSLFKQRLTRERKLWAFALAHTVNSSHRHIHTLLSSHLHTAGRRCWSWHRCRPCPPSTAPLAPSTAPSSTWNSPFSEELKPTISTIRIVDTLRVFIDFWLLLIYPLNNKHLQTKQRFLTKLWIESHHKSTLIYAF